jgi:hypothetical protein
METALKQSLLLTHGTVYGHAMPAVPVGFTGMSASIERHNVAGFNWDADVPYLATYTANPLGTMTDNSPIDIISWTVTGSPAVDLLAPWRQCAVLLTRL